MINNQRKIYANIFLFLSKVQIFNGVALTISAFLSGLSIGSTGLSFHQRCHHCQDW